MNAIPAICRALDAVMPKVLERPAKAHVPCGGTSWPAARAGGALLWQQAGRLAGQPVHLLTDLLQQLVRPAAAQTARAQPASAVRAVRRAAGPPTRFIEVRAAPAASRKGLRRLSGAPPATAAGCLPCTARRCSSLVPPWPPHPLALTAQTSFTAAACRDRASDHHGRRWQARCGGGGGPGCPVGRCVHLCALMCTSGQALCMVLSGSAGMESLQAVHEQICNVLLCPLLPFRRR